MTTQALCAYYLARGLVFERHFVCNKTKMLFDKTSVLMVLRILKHLIEIMDSSDTRYVIEYIESEIINSKNKHINKLFGNAVFDMKDISSNTTFDSKYDKVKSLMLSHIKIAESELNKVFYNSRIVSKNLNSISNFPYVFISPESDNSICIQLGRKSRLSISEAMDYYNINLHR